jgi:hypothetical protein
MQGCVESIESVRVAPTPPADLPSKEVLRILMLPDLHIPSGERQQEILLENRDFLDRHDWVVLLGDVTACYGTPAEYAHVARFVEALNRPYSVVNGNHEFFFQPMVDGSTEYGKKWDRSRREVQLSQLERFHRFFGIESCFQAAVHPTFGICMLGLDEIGHDDSAILSKEHEAWFDDFLSEMPERPLLVYSHFPMQDSRLDNIRYYVRGRRPYYAPSKSVREKLQNRTPPTLWFSGHVHFEPTHPLAKPYRTDNGVWQVHCPDGRGFGRRDNSSWFPAHHDGLFARSVFVSSDRLSVITTDVERGIELDEQQFSPTGST